MIDSSTLSHYSISHQIITSNRFCVAQFCVLAYHNLTQSEPDLTSTLQSSGNELIINTCTNQPVDKTIIKA